MIKSLSISEKGMKLNVLLVLFLLVFSSFAVVANNDFNIEENLNNGKEKRISKDLEDQNVEANSDSQEIVLFSEDFEDSTLNDEWGSWDFNPLNGRDYWGLTNNRSHNGSQSLYCSEIGTNANGNTGEYDNSMSSDAMINQSWNLNYSSATLSFYIWYDISDVPQNDHFAVVSKPKGAPPEPLQEVPGTRLNGSSNGWKQVTVQLPYNLNLPLYRLGFRFISDGLYEDSLAGTNLEGAYIDDITVTIDTNRSGQKASPDHSVKESDYPGFHAPSEMVQTDSQHMWFTANWIDANHIGRFNLSSENFTLFQIPWKGSIPTGLTYDGDGSLWFTDIGADRIGRYNLATDTFSNYTLDPGSKPMDIYWDGNNIWFTQWGGGKLSRLNPSDGDIDSWEVNRRWGVTAPPLPRGITEGPNGKIWITEAGDNEITGFDPSTSEFDEHIIPHSTNTRPVDLTFDNSGKIWFTEMVTCNIGKFDPSSGMSSSYEEIELNSSAQPSRIIHGKDNNIWFTQSGIDRIGKIDPSTQALSEWDLPSSQHQKSAPEGIISATSSEFYIAEWWDGQITKFNSTNESFQEWSIPRPYLKDLTPTLAPAEKNFSFISQAFDKNIQSVDLTYTFPNGTSNNVQMDNTLIFSYNHTIEVPNQEGNIDYQMTVTNQTGNTMKISDSVKIIPKPNANLGVDRTFDENHIAVLDGTESTTPNETIIVQYKWEFGDGSEVIEFGPPVITHNYSTPGDYTATLTVRDNLGNSDSDTVNLTVKPGEGTKVLLLDYLKGQGPIANRRLSNKTPNMLNDSMEKGFWSGINSSSEFDIIRRPPIYNEPRVDGKEYNISDYIQDFSPKIIIISDCILNGSDRWSLNMSERLTLMDYLEKGNGLMVTGGSLYDLREKTPESSRDIGQWGHTERLHLSEASSLNEVLKYYRSSITANIGLGLFPLYEEIRHYVGKAFENMYEAAQDPLEEALYFSASTVSYSVPLLPANIPFKANFNRMEENPNITKNLDNQFSLDLENRYSKGTDRSVGNISKETNLTSAGWQLEYPFLMAHNALNRTRTQVQSLGEIRDTMVENLTSGLDSFNQFFDFNNTKYSIGNLSVGDSPANFGEDDLRNITENITSSLLQALKNMYNARTNRPSEIEINVNFTVGNKTVNKTVVIPIPVTLQKLFRPAKIATMSNDGMASVLKYEMNGQRYDFEEGTPLDYKNFDPIKEIPVSYRSTYFTFKPSLGNDNSTKLVLNSLSWLKNTSEPKAYELIGSMEVPEKLANKTRENITQQELKSAKNQSLLLKPKQNYTLNFSVNDSAQINVYWWGANKTNVTLAKNGSSVEVEPTRLRNSSFYAATFQINQTGNWTLIVRVDADGLKTPLMAQKIQTSEVDDTTDPDVDITSPSEGTITSTSSMRVEWSGSDSGSGIERYEIQLDGGDWINVNKNTSYTFSGLSDGSHTVEVKAADDAGNTATDTVSFTVDTTALPSAPQNLQASAGDRKVELTWDALSDDGGSEITEYKIYRGTSSGNLTYYESVDGNTTSYTDTDLTNNQTYYYQVSAVNIEGESNLSDEASATPSALDEQNEDETDDGTSNETDSDGEDIPGFTSTLLLLAVITAVAIYQKKKRKS